MALVNSIGDFQFLTMRGEVFAPRQMLEMDQRAGVEGTEFTLLAAKGTPFQVFTQVDAPSFAHAQDESVAYLEAIEDGTLSLTKDGVDFSGYGFEVKVLNVTPVNIRAIRSAVGGINPPSLAWLEAVWDLIAVAIVGDEPEEP